MEVLFVVILVLLMAGALASGFPVAFALPGSAIISILLAAAAGTIATGNPDAFFAQGGPTNWLSAGVTNFRGIYWEVERDTLIAIPLFVFMGIMLQRSKIAEDLLVSMAQLFGPIRGGLGISVVFVGALLAATTGILGATVVAMGLISLPAMMRNNYANWLSTGTIAASGTLGQIIPPSIVLIILADQLSNAVDQASSLRTNLYKAATGDFSMPSEFAVSSTSAGDMFMGALIPGLVLVGLYMLFIFVVAFIRRDIAPPVPFEGSYDRRFALRVTLALVPPLTLIFVVLGSIITGVATVNQAGAIGAIGATVMAGYRLYEGRRGAFWPAILTGGAMVAILVITNVWDINIRAIHGPSEQFGVTLAVIATVVFLIGVTWSLKRTYQTNETLQGVMMETAKTTSLVFIILLGAAMLTSAFRGFGGEELVKEFLLGMPGGFWAQFIIVMAVIFILGFFLDFIEIAVVVVPIVAPILLADPSANITAVWLGVMIGLNIQTSFLTPPFGFALFYLRGVAPAAVKTLQMYKGVVPFIALQLLALVIVGLNPPLVNYLPTRISLLGETAPPPQNPRLQACIEDYVHEAFLERGDEIRAAIQSAQSWDLSGVPSGIANNVTRAVAGAGNAFQALEDARASTAAIDEAAGVYDPIRTEVRRIEADLRRHEEELKAVRQRVGQLQRQAPDEVATIQRLQDRVDVLQAEKEVLEAEMPETWDEVHAEFKKLLAVEKRAYLNYRRVVDSAYEPIQEFMRILRGADGLVALEAELKGLADIIRSGDSEAAIEQIQAMESRVGDIEGAGDIRSALSKARRELRTTNTQQPDANAALQEHAKAVEDLESEIAWRTRAGALLPQVEAYEDAIDDTIGLRQQPRLPREIALHVASCSSEHRNISLNF
ncbi:MAG: TRAP transporter large permease subunit [Alphaproteobacteria bacterium]|nr:TRAP transporter large permease subunit [Alphaproteobacteria bacterium]